ncbi:MAG TPA: hypothetical protein VGO52_23415 [Hyphomonadaceae bacterium]|jgi:hypothetical protein|nr:hypothetical protein [Hyphomonadaceae bacterium]
MAATKKPAARKSVKAEAEAPGGAQPAAARRSAEAQLRALIDKYASDLLRPISAIRRALRKRLPTAVEIVYEYNGFFVISYSPSEHGYEGVLALRASADGIRLYLSRGKELPDPAKLLKKAGGETRWIDLEGASTLASPEVARLIEAAIAFNRAPFPRTGAGSMIMSPSTAKKRK